MLDRGALDSAQPSAALVVDADADFRADVVSVLGRLFETVRVAADTESALAQLEAEPPLRFDVVVAELDASARDAFVVLRAAIERQVGTRVLVTSRGNSIQRAVEAMRIGAFDFIELPVSLERLATRVRHAIGLPPETDGLEPGGADTPGTPHAQAREAWHSIVAESQAMKDAVDLATRVADTRSTVLITGETGTGKEVIAGLIHRTSRRADGPIVKVNCAALPETLLESELFGHERGAFTGADRRRMGRFEEASGGTLFLDEIGDITLPTQAKLLRVLQDQEFYRLGGTQPLRTDARIIAATNRDLVRAKDAGTFREDLYFRLDVIGIHLAPLRDRPEDLCALAERLRAEIGAGQPGRTPRFSRAALEAIDAYPWPGNVRELGNVIERALLTASGDTIEVRDLNLVGSDGAGAPSWRFELPPGGVGLEAAERDLVVATLERVGWVQKDAAVLLRISRRKLNYIVRKLGLTHPSWRRNRAPRDAARADS